MDAQCLLGDTDTLDVEREGDAEEGRGAAANARDCCFCCGSKDGSKGRQLRKHHPCQVPLVCLRDICRNRVCRECARFFSLCIAVVILVIGVQKKELCPFEPAIPVFLLVDGSILALHTAISTLLLCKERKKPSDPDVDKLDNLGILLKVLILFLVLWNLAGSVWIYSAEKIVQFKNSVRTNYCDVTAYYVAFGLVTSAYIVVGVVIVLIVATVTSLYLYQMCTGVSWRRRMDTQSGSPDSITHI